MTRQEAAEINEIDELMKRAMSTAAITLQAALDTCEVDANARRIISKVITSLDKFSKAPPLVVKSGDPRRI